jgi:transposase
VLERRAMHIREQDVFQFVEELSNIDCSHHNLVFLDEVSFDNRGIIRKRGYSLKGQKLAIRGDFQRKPRISVLAFIGVSGLIDCFDTQSTFDRVKFVKCCQDFAYAKRNHVRQYPGSNSVWILDGASIHKHPEIVHFLRSIGIVPIFLPVYWSFCNPIEFMFGYLKRIFQWQYDEKSGRDLLPFAVQAFQRFDTYNMANVFEHCSWKMQGFFDPSVPMSTETRAMPKFWEECVESNDGEYELEFNLVDDQSGSD